MALPSLSILRARLPGQKRPRLGESMASPFSAADDDIIVSCRGLFFQLKFVFLSASHFVVFFLLSHRVSQRERLWDPRQQLTLSRNNQESQEKKAAERVLLFARMHYDALDKRLSGRP